MPTSTRARYILGLLLGVLVMSAQSLPGKPPDGPPPYNIIILEPDQLRAESIHAYGYSLPDTPNIDALSKQGTLFLRAYSSGTWTTPSIGAIFTGLFPTVHGMALPPYLGCGPSITRPMLAGGLPDVPPFVSLSLLKPTLPEVLKRHGMITAADNANCWSFFDLAHRGWDSFKFFSGFQLEVPGHTDMADPFYNTAPGTLAWAEQWLTAHQDQRFFFWVHFMEPHSPYNPPREYDQFRTPEDFPGLYEDTSEGLAQLHSLSQLGDFHAIRREEELYAAKILYVDHYVGELMKTLHSLKLDEKTIIVFTSDHGELLYSHPEDYNTTDHISLYDTNQHIPLIFRGPGIPSGRRVGALISHYDLAPTILDLENLPPLTRGDGASFKPIVLGGPPAQVHDYLYGEQLDLIPAFSVRNDHYKLIENLPEGETKCFDNLTDPEERRNICAEIPQTAATLKKALDLHIQADRQEAKSYADWEDNLALAVLEQRDSRGLLLLAPREAMVQPGSGNSEFQLNGRGFWSPLKDANCESGLCYWASPGHGEASVIWRTEMPLTGEYEIYFRYGGRPPATGRLATNASLTVKFKGGSLAFPLDQNQNQGRWTLLGRFDHPTSVTLANVADGPVVAGSIRFLRVEGK
jgi:arylsulfatase A-like enzyme